MQRILFTLIAAFAFSSARGALVTTNIPLDLGPVGRTTGGKTFTFTDMNGTGFNGQSVAFDFTFDNSELVTLFNYPDNIRTSTSFMIQVHFETSASVDNFDNGSAFVFDANGNPGPNSVFSSGGTTLALAPLASDGELNRRTDIGNRLTFSGIHFELIFPDAPGAEITGGQIRFIIPGGSGDIWQIDPIPDSGSTLLLLAVGLVVVMGTQAWRPVLRHH